MIESAPQASSPYSWLRVALVILLVFLLGFGLGAGGVLLGVRYVVRRELTAPAQQGGAEPIDRFMARLEARLDTVLKLNPEEHQMVHDELATDTAQFKQQRNAFYRSLRGMLGDSVYRIASRLPPEKGAKLREIVKRRFEPWGIVPGDSPGPSGGAVGTPPVTGGPVTSGT